MILKLRQTPGIYLVGFMGSGKTTVGRLLAERLGWNFIDIDQAIEAKRERTIAGIFDALGEEEFRRIETEEIRQRVRSIAAGNPAVVSLGGGAFAQPVNAELLENHGVTIWLDCPLEMLQERVGQAAHRPLARDPQKFEELYRARREMYAHADYRIEIHSNDPEDAVRAIMNLGVL